MTRKFVVDDSDEYKPKTIREAMERCFIHDGSVDLDLIFEQPRRPLDWICRNLKDSIIKACELNSNPELLKACNVKTPNDAVRVIIKAIMKDYKLITIID